LVRGSIYIGRWKRFYSIFVEAFLFFPGLPEARQRLENILERLRPACLPRTLEALEQLCSVPARRFLQVSP
jgi:hypothetical protein